MMRLSHFLVLALLLALPACSGGASGNGGASQTPASANVDGDDGLNGPALDGTQVDSDDLFYNGANAGTQQDLVVNVGDRVLFGFDRYDVDAQARQVLDRQAQWLLRYPHLTVTIEGHADERGTREYNLALGDRRATSVKNYLVALGVDSSRITTISYGKERPAVPESNEAAWAQNRRGVTIVQ